MPEISLDQYKSLLTEIIKKQDISSTIRGRTNINGQISDVLSLAKKEVIICATVIEIKKKLKLLEPILKQIGDNGIKITMAVNGPDAEIKQISERLKIKIKKADISTSFYIADSKEIVFMLNDSAENHEQMAVWFSSDFFVNSYSIIYRLEIKSVILCSGNSVKFSFAAKSNNQIVKV